MNLALALLAAAPAMPAAPPATPPATDVGREIVVIAKQMRGWKGGVSKVNGRMVCRTSQSSGDKALDAIRCGAMLTCMKPLEPRIDALMASDRSRREKRDGFDAMVKSAEPCVTAYESDAVSRLAATRVRP